MSLKRLLVGNPLKTEQAAHERLSKKTALAVFSSDALSSTAYATEEILLVLAVAAAATQGMSFNYVVPISVGIAVLLAIVATSYRQTIHAHPSGGGAYIVAKENLGTTPNPGTYHHVVSGPGAWAGLENRSGRKATVGSNPTLSAISLLTPPTQSLTRGQDLLLSGHFNVSSRRSP